jgi:hypothetical protein
MDVSSAVLVPLKPKTFKEVVSDTSKVKFVSVASCDEEKSTGGSSTWALGYYILPCTDEEAAVGTCFPVNLTSVSPGLNLTAPFHSPNGTAGAPKESSQWSSGAGKKWENTCDDWSGKVRKKLEDSAQAAQKKYSNLPETTFIVPTCSNCGKLWRGGTGGSVSSWFEYERRSWCLINSDNFWGTSFCC